MRFDVIEREPDYYFSTVREELEKVLNAARETDETFFVPRAEIRETDSEYKIKIQLPGVNKEDIDIELDKNILTVSAEAKQDKTADNEYVHSSQFSYGKYQRTIETEKEIDVDNSECSYENGILTVILKKIEDKKETKKLKIK